MSVAHYGSLCRYVPRILGRRSPLRLTIAAVIGAVGALIVELTHRSILLLVRLATTET